MAAAVWAPRAGSGGGGAPLEPEPRPEATDDPDASLEADLDPDRGPRPIGDVQVGPPGEYASVGKTFDGAGTIAGQVRTPPGVPFPASWTLTIEPSRYGEGREHAVTRVVELPGNQTSFEAIDLPMASYRVTASAEGLASTPTEVALHGLEGYPNLPGVDYVTVSLTMQPLGAIHGTVRTAEGGFAEGVRVTVEEHGTSRRVETVTSPAGTWSVEGLASGGYRVLVGDPDRPMVPPVDVAHRERSTEVEPITIPPTATVELVLYDRLGRPVPGTEISGYLRGPEGGGVRATTDGAGRALLRHLKPGPWRFEGRHRELELRGRLDALLAAGDATQELELHLKRE